MALPLSILVNGVERKTEIEFQSVRKQDNLNNSADIFEFESTYHAGQTWRPVVNQEVQFFINSIKEFGGVIVEIEEMYDGPGILRYRAVAKDYSHHFDRLLVTERFENMTVQDIVLELLVKYAPTFTGLGVEGALIDVEAATFDRMPLTDVINQLASQNNYSWYIDYDKDLHFFDVNDELSPFNLTDTSANYIYDTLQFTTDFTQIRNRILFKGGDAETNVRTETLSGTGTKEEFVLAYKYAELPTVEVGGTPQTVGIDNLDDEADFDCLWSYQQKYLKFSTGHIPAAGTDNIEVTGIPLLPLNVRVSDSTSIAAYGPFEYFKEEQRVSKKEDLLVFANAELQAYKDPLREGSFETQVQGLRSGQTINVNSALRGINEDFLIQSVETTLLSQDSAVYRVELATLKTLRLTQLFQSLFRKKNVDIDSLESLFSFLQYTDTFSITDSHTIDVLSSPPYRYGPTGMATAGTWNKSTWE